MNVDEALDIIAGHELSMDQCIFLLEAVTANIGALYEENTLYTFVEDMEDKID